jgi:outer membrane protein assembly factor BamB
LNGEIIFGNVGTIAGANAEITALDTDMDVLWTYPTGAKCFASPAIGANGTIYGACGRKIFALNPNGTLLWEYTIARGRAIISSPAIASNGTLYVAADQVYAFQDE